MPSLDERIEALSTPTSPEEESFKAAEHRTETLALLLVEKHGWSLDDALENARRVILGVDPAQDGDVPETF